jgi:hypothetical protein
MDREERDMIGNQMPDWEIPKDDEREMRGEIGQNDARRRAGEYDTQYGANRRSNQEDMTNGSDNIWHSDNDEGLTEDQMKTGHVEHSTGVRRPPNYEPRGQEFQPPAEADREEWRNQQ